MRKIVFPFPEQKNTAVKLDTEKSIRICESNVDSGYRYVLYRKKQRNEFFFVCESYNQYNKSFKEVDIYWPCEKVYSDMSWGIDGHYHRCDLRVGSVTWDGHIHSVKQFVAAFASVETYEQWFGKLPD